MEPETLIIQPVGYHGSSLDEVGSRVVQALHPVLGDYKIHDTLQAYSLDPALIKNCDMKEFIVVKDFLKFLSHLELPVLGITSLPCIESAAEIGKRDGQYYGFGSISMRSAYVSTALPEFGEPDTDGHIEKLIIESLHEVGHVFNLGHHLDMVKTENGKLCPMTTGHHSRVKTIEEYITSRDSSSFCGECYDRLGLANFILQKYMESPV